MWKPCGFAWVPYLWWWAYWAGAVTASAARWQMAYAPKPAPTLRSGLMRHSVQQLKLVPRPMPSMQPVRQPGAWLR